MLASFVLELDGSCIACLGSACIELLFLGAVHEYFLYQFLGLAMEHYHVRAALWRFVENGGNPSSEILENCLSVLEFRNCTYRVLLFI